MDIKQQIINATIDLIIAEDDINKVSIRKIAKNANIGIGLINYHFQTRHNLIKLALRTLINSRIANWKNAIEPPKTDSKLELLTNMFQATADFLAAYPKVSKISILNDLSQPTLDDNMTSTLRGILPILKLYNSKEAILAGIEVINQLQWRFLRNDINKEYLQFDFYDQTHRKQFINEICFEKFSKFENNK